VQSNQITAMEYLNNPIVKNTGIALGSAATGYVVGKTLNDHLETSNPKTKNIPESYIPAKDEIKGFNKEQVEELVAKKTIEMYGHKQDDKLTAAEMLKIVKLTSTITAHNEKTKAVREGLVAAGLALVATQVDKSDMLTKNSLNKNLSLWFINNFFDTYRAGETVWNKTGYLKTYMTNGSVNWSNIGKTATYALAALAQIKMPSFLHPRLKPLEKVLTRSILNKGVEMIFNNSANNLSKEEIDQKKFNEGFKDMLTSGHAVYSIFNSSKN